MSAYIYSRFDKTDRVLYDGHETYGRWNNPITEQLLNSLSPYVVNQYAGRPDLIAYQLYGNSSFDWLLIAVNNATESLNWPRAGTTILVPSASLISSELI
jgi:hypothetical protein